MGARNRTEAALAERAGELEAVRRRLGESKGAAAAEVKRGAVRGQWEKEWRRGSGVWG